LGGHALRILVLTDRDWTHPQGGGTGTHLWEQITRWTDQGHSVTVVASAYRGAVRHEVLSDRLEIHRLGGRATLFPRVLWTVRRKLVPQADIVLEIVNGIPFLTPLWLDGPRITLIHHIHRDHYIAEMGAVAGGLCAFLIETVPLRTLYRRSRFLTVSEATAQQITDLGIAADQITVVYNGVDTTAMSPGVRDPDPTILFLGRLKRYKRIEMLLDALEAIPGAVLDIAGAGDHRPDLERDIARRGLTGRVRLHGFVDEEEKIALMQRAWVHATASSNEGWCLTVTEAAACGTTTVAMDVGGLRESVIHGRTGLLAGTPEEFANGLRNVLSDAALRENLADSALVRAKELSWDKTAESTLALLRLEHAKASSGLAAEPTVESEPKPAVLT